MIYIIDGCDPNHSNWMRYVTEKNWKREIFVICFVLDKLYVEIKGQDKMMRK